MLQVLCLESELQEYHEVIAVGDQVSRMAEHRDGVFYSSSLDEIQWDFDRYAWLTGTRHATISGTVTAIDAFYFRLTRQPEGGWGPAPGTTWREPITTTAATRKARKEIEWSTPSTLDGEGHSFRSGHRVIREDDEQLNGWLLTLENEHIETVEHTFGAG